MELSQLLIRPIRYKDRYCAWNDGRYKFDCWNAYTVDWFLGHWLLNTYVWESRSGLSRPDPRQRNARAFMYLTVRSITPTCRAPVWNSTAMTAFVFTNTIRLVLSCKIHGDTLRIRITISEYINRRKNIHERENRSSENFWNKNFS